MIVEQISNQKLNGKDKKLNFHGQKIHGVLEQVSEILCHLLEDLNYIYRANGINYLVQNYHTTLIRLLTPFQLLTQFRMVDNSDLYQCEKLVKNKSSKNQVIEQINKCQKGKDLKLIPEVSQQKKCTVSKANKKYYYRDRSKPILDQNVEDQLVQWAMDKLLQNQKIRRKDLARKALRLNHNQNGFGGSLGWVRRFLERHPQLDREMKKSSLLRKRNRSSKVSQSSSDESNNFQFQMSKILKQNDSVEKIDNQSDYDKSQKMEEISSQNQQILQSNENNKYWTNKKLIEGQNQDRTLQNFNYYQPEKKNRQIQRKNIGSINNSHYLQYLDHHKNWNSYGRNKEGHLSQRKD